MEIWFMVPFAKIMEASLNDQWVFQDYIEL
jgi:hypothetical protein